LRKTTFLGACALSGLACMSFAPQAQAQLTLKHYTQTETISLFNGSGSIDWQPFSTSLVGNAAATLSSVQYSLTGSGTASGSISNNSGAAKSFTYLTGGYVSSSLSGGPSLSLNLLATASNHYTLQNGGTVAYGPKRFSASSSAGVLNNGDFTGPNPIALTINSNGLTEFTGNSSGLSSVSSGTGTVTAKLTYAYYVPFTPVPELGTSISLGLMGLVGGALGLRARRRSK